MNETPTALGPTSHISARLYAIRFPARGDPIVTFEVFSTGHVLEGPHRLLAEISNKVPLVLASEDDYDLIVACAAHKLVQDLEAVAEAVHEEYVDGRIGVA